VPGDLLQVGIHVVRANAAWFAVLVQVLEQLLAGQVLAARHDARQARVRDFNVIDLAALAPEPKANPLRADVGVAVAHGGQAERAVLARILLVADADAGLLQ
jgi:hypothetical protein